MIRVLAIALAAVPCAITAQMAPPRAVLAAAACGWLLSVVGIAALWRWPVTAAACVLLTAYTAALWLGDAPLRVGGAVAVGLSLVLSLASVDLARAMRRASVDGRVVRSQALAWLALALGALAATLLLLSLAGGLAAWIPAGTAPFLAAAGSLGVIFTLVAMLRGSWPLPWRPHGTQ